MDYKKFKNNIPNRIELVNELIEEVNFLIYDINPIGPPTFNMWEAMRKSTQAQIDICREKLNKIEHSLNDC